MSTPYQASPEVRERAIAARQEQLRERLVEFAAQRRQTAEQEARVKQLKAAQASLIENDVAREKEWKAQRDATEAAVRAIALEIHSLDPSAACAPGVSIVSTKVLAYNKEKALEWAKAKGMFLIPAQLDTKAFEAFLKTSAQHSDFADYTITLEPTTKIASDLDLALSAAARMAAPTPTAEEPF